jgi:hypothetical protein
MMGKAPRKPAAPQARKWRMAEKKQERNMSCNKSFFMHLPVMKNGIRSINGRMQHSPYFLLADVEL